MKPKKTEEQTNLIEIYEARGKVLLGMILAIFGFVLGLFVYPWNLLLNIIGGGIIGWNFRRAFL